jgi:hypothetical protein
MISVSFVALYQLRMLRPLQHKRGCLVLKLKPIPMPLSWRESQLCMPLLAMEVTVMMGAKRWTCMIQQCIQKTPPRLTLAIMLSLLILNIEDTGFPLDKDDICGSATSSRSSRWVGWCYSPTTSPNLQNSEILSKLIEYYYMSSPTGRVWGKRAISSSKHRLKS